MFKKKLPVNVFINISTYWGNGYYVILFVKLDIKATNCKKLAISILSNLYSLTQINTEYELGVCGQIHTHTVLLPGKESLVPTE